MLYQLVTLICLGLLVAEMLYVLFASLLKKPAARVAFLRSFKKGKCAIVYVTAIPLYFIGHLYSGMDVLASFFTAINKIINVVVLKFELSSIEGLMQASALYEFTVYFCFVLIMFNALLFTFSLVGQALWVLFSQLWQKCTRKPRLFVFGYNEGSIQLLQSEHKRHKTLVAHLDEGARAALYQARLPFINSKTMRSGMEQSFKTALRGKGRECICVINTEQDETNMRLCRTYIDRLRALGEKERNQCFRCLRIFVFGDPRFATIYEDIVNDSLGCIQYVNKYQRIAMDFVDRYPLALFLDETHLNYQTSCVREGVELNVLLVGFGKTNQEIFLTSVANNQFLKQVGEGVASKQVHYHIFDKTQAENNKNLNHSYYRYKNECLEQDPSAYLPLPEAPATEEYWHLDINDTEFYNRIRRITSRPQDANFVVIAFGSDLENIDMAQKLVEKRREWGIKNLVIFVKSRAFLKEHTLLEQEGCYFIGHEAETVYDIERLVGDRIYRMAKLRSAIYALEYDLSQNPGLEITEKYFDGVQEAAHRNWYIKRKSVERDSNLFGCLSLRSKLNLMGLDYCLKEEGDSPAVTEEEYLALYAADDPPEVEEGAPTALGKTIKRYSLSLKPSRRTFMAEHEHLRWNAFMISRGIIPATREQIMTEKSGDSYTLGKNYALRRHGNITTFEGLIEFRRIAARLTGRSEEACDVIKYDFQLLDDAYWLLNATGHKIIRKRT